MIFGKKERVTAGMATEALGLMKTFKVIFEAASAQKPNSEPRVIEIAVPPISDIRVVWLGWAIMNDWVLQRLGKGIIEKMAPIVNSMRAEPDARSDSPSKG